MQNVQICACSLLTNDLGVTIFVMVAWTCFRYLIEQDFPGSRVGPEPTTDCFTAIMYGEPEGIIPGNALTVDPKKPFRNLDPFGNAFLNR